MYFGHRWRKNRPLPEPERAPDAASRRDLPISRIRSSEATEPRETDRLRVASAQRHSRRRPLAQRRRRRRQRRRFHLRRVDARGRKNLGQTWPNREIFETW